MDFYRVISRQARGRLNKGGRIFLEVGLGQAQAVKEMLTGFEVSVIKDMQGIDRIISGVAND